MKIIAVETATEACSAALYLDGSVHERYQVAPREHAALLLPMVQELLAEAGLALQGLDGVAFGRGPGSFTGVRIAASVAQGLAFAADLPVVPISTLAALAQGAWRQRGRERVAAAIDARMQEVYWGCYALGDGAVMRCIGEEGVFAPEATPLADTGYYGAGSGWAAHGPALELRQGDHVVAEGGDRLPQAVDVATLAAHAFAAGEMCPAEQALPVYLRDKVTHQRAG